MLTEDRSNLSSCVEGSMKCDEEDEVDEVDEVDDCPTVETD